MRNRYQPPRERDLSARIRTALRGLRTTAFRSRSRKIWRAAQLGVLAVVGLVALFVHSAPSQTAPVQTASDRTPQHPPAPAGSHAGPGTPAAAPAGATSPALAPPASPPASAPGAVQTTTSGSSGLAGGSDDDGSGHGGRDGDGDGDD